jgi:hypothetical protein
MKALDFFLEMKERHDDVDTKVANILVYRNVAICVHWFYGNYDSIIIPLFADLF